MAVTQAIVALSTSTPTSLDPVTTYTNPSRGDVSNYSWNSATMIIQNTHGSATVYIGTSAVTSSAYGISIPFGASVTIDGLLPTETLYAVASTTGVNVAVLSLLR